MSEHAIREYLKTIGNGGGVSQETDPVFTASPASGISAQDIADWNDKQDELVSGTNIKTINGQSLLGSGDLPVAPPVTSTDVPTADTISEFDSDAHMNSTDMTTGSGGELEDFIDGLNVSGGGVTTVQFTPLYGSNYANYGNCYYQIIGRIAHVHLGISGLTANTGRVVYNLPSDVRPSTNIYGHGTSGSAATIASVEVRSNGEVYVYPNTNTYCGADVVYFI